MLDPVRNFARCTVSTGYAAGATTVVLSASEGAKLPDPATEGAFNVVWWNYTDYPNPTDDPDHEIVRVTARSTDTLTITRAQEGTSDENHNIGGKTYLMINALTKKTMDQLSALVASNSGKKVYAGTATFSGTGTQVITTGFLPVSITVFASCVRSSSQGVWTTDEGNNCSYMTANADSSGNSTSLSWYTPFSGGSHSGTIVSVTNTGFTLSNTESGAGGDVYLTFLAEAGDGGSHFISTETVVTGNLTIPDGTSSIIVAVDIEEAGVRISGEVWLNTESKTTAYFAGTFNNPIWGVDFSIVGSSVVTAWYNPSGGGLPDNYTLTAYYYSGGPFGGTGNGLKTFTDDPGSTTPAQSTSTQAYTVVVDAGFEPKEISFVVSADVSTGDAWNTSNNSDIARTSAVVKCSVENDTVVWHVLQNSASAVAPNARPSLNPFSVDRTTDSGPVDIAFGDGTLAAVALPSNTPPSSTSDFAFTGLSVSGNVITFTFDFTKGDDNCYVRYAIRELEVLGGGGAPTPLFACGSQTFSSTTTVTISPGFEVKKVRLSVLLNGGAADRMYLSQGAWDATSGNKCIYNGFNGTSQVTGASANGWYMYASGLNDTHTGNVTNVTGTTFDLDNTKANSATDIIVFWEAEG